MCVGAFSRSDMLQLTGDILNWLAAGVLFPFMLLPIAPLFQRESNNNIAGAVTWLCIVIGIIAAGLVFVALVPRLSMPTDGPGVVQPLLIQAALVTAVILAIAAGGGPRKTVAAVAQFFEAVTRLSGRAVMWLLLLMALVQFAVVLLRYVFGVNFISMQESITYMHGLVFLVAAGYALLTDDHVRVDIFYRSAPPKRKALIDLAGTYLFLFPICLLILWTASPYVARSWLVMEGSADTSGIQGVFLLKSVIAVFAVLLGMAGFVVAHKAVETLTGKTA